MDRVLRCIVIDDEPLALGLIAGYVRNTPSLSLEGTFTSAAEAISIVMSGDIDLVFLDINMPLLSGIEFASVIPSRSRIVFTTAYDNYAVEGFRLSALDYLLKPVSYSDFMRAVSKGIEWFRIAEPGDTVRSSNSGISYISVRTEGRLLRLRTDSILYAEACNDRVMLFRNEGEPVSVLMSLTELERLLPADEFMRVHRSFIVRLQGVEIVERGRIVYGRTYIPVADSRREEFLSRING